MEYKDYQDWFEDAATRHVLIQHTHEVPRFCDVDPEEILESLRSGVDYNNYCMVLEAFDIRTDDNFSDNIRGLYSGAFWIIRHCDKSDIVLKKEILNTSLNIVLSVLSKIKKEKGSLGPSVPQFIDLSSVEINKIGPVNDNCYGWRASFNFNNSLSKALKYINSDWL